MKRLLIILLVARASLLTSACLASPPPWSVQVSTNTAGPWIMLTNVNRSAGFARLQGPSGASVSIGNIVTTTNATSNAAAGTPLSCLPSPPGITSDITGKPRTNYNGGVDPGT